jgi:hypothetical protein
VSGELRNAWKMRSLILYCMWRALLKRRLWWYLTKDLPKALDDNFPPWSIEP